MEQMGLFTITQLKWGSLVVLFAQNCSFWVLQWYCRKHVSSEGSYLASTVVVAIEFVKLAICLTAVAVTEGSVDGLRRALLKDIWEDKVTTLKVGIPALLYTISNNCLYLSTAYLDGSTAQILYQGKLLATAWFSVTILGKVLSCTKWGALTVLTLGAMAVQMNASKPTSDSQQGDTRQALVGLMIVATGCILSSGAGVWFERMLKGSSTGLWMRNVQLGMFSIVVGIFGCILQDGEAIRNKGALQGYQASTWLLVMNQAAGGLLVATAVKYADNIYKNFACTLSILVSTLVVYVVAPEDSPLSVMFVCGATLVLGSTYVYGQADMMEKQLPQSQEPEVEPLEEAQLLDVEEPAAG